MKSKVLIFSVLGLIILGIAGVGYLKSVPGAENNGEDLPKIEITPKVYEFGSVEYGDILNYTFEVRNSGKGILKIKKIATSCGCTTAKISSPEIMPGETAELSVIYNTGLMGGSHGRGRQERIIYLKSNDPRNPQAEAFIYANVQ